MKIFIITMEDPLYTLPFIKDIITARQNDICGVAISKGGRLKIGNKRSKIIYLISLLLIMGLGSFVKNVYKTVIFKLKTKYSRFFPTESPCLESFCKKKNIPVYKIQSPNNVNFLEILKREGPDLIINQSQYIIKKELLAIPKIGMLNRHNALLPKNRGRLTPFWVIFNKEKETGVSIHFVDEGMDSGPIVIQEKYVIEPKDDFNSIVEKNYQIASTAMLKAIALIEKGNFVTIQNSESEATYNTIPTFKEAFKYRFGS